MPHLEESAVMIILSTCPLPDSALRALPSFSHSSIHLLSIHCARYFLGAVGVGVMTVNKIDQKVYPKGAYSLTGKKGNKQ